jgi:plastocyanin
MPRRNAPRTRRHALQAGAAAAGILLFASATRPNPLPQAFARDNGDDDHDDTSGHGRGRGRGRGGDDDQRQEGAAQTAPVPPGAVEIRIVSDDAGGFVPGELTVDLGQTVAFVNTHSDEHTATGSGFDTGIIPEGGVATVVLEKPGTFRYACRIHPEMTGQIAMRDANGVVPPPATPAASPVAGAASVRIANLAFDPPTITVPAGSTVTWSNDDVTPHTVTAVDGQFDSGIFDPGANFSWTFRESGTFAYQCLLHPNMQGRVVVEGGGPAAGSPVPATN